MVCPEGFEPPTPSLGNSYSIQLNYGHILAEHTGIEPVIFAVTGRRVNRYTNAPGGGP